MAPRRRRRDPIAAIFEPKHIYVPGAEILGEVDVEMLADNAMRPRSIGPTAAMPCTAGACCTTSFMKLTSMPIVLGPAPCFLRLNSTMRSR